MLLNRKLLQARTLFYLTKIEAKLLGNVVLARRYFFLTHSKAAGDQKLKKYLQTMFRTRALIFTSQFTSVAKELEERKIRPAALHSRRTSASPILAGQRDHSYSIRTGTQPVRPCSSCQPTSASSTWVTSARRGATIRGPWKDA